MNVPIVVVYQVILGVLALLVLAVAAYKWYLSRHTLLTCKKATRIFRNHGALRGWKVLEDVTIGEGDKAVTVDQLVIGPFGVIVACDLHQKGKVYGELTATEWILAKGEDGAETKTRITSPYYRATQGMEQLAKRLSKEKIYRVPIEVLVPKTGAKQLHYITGISEFMLTLREVKTLLGKSRFEKDNGVKVEQIAALFTK